ncbi:MAG: hypothetical protein ACM369_11455 [Acidobacteriota bacterium]
MGRAASRLVLTAAALLLGIGILTAALVAVREPFALNDYAAIWGLKARALHRSGSFAALFRVDPDGAFSHPEYPPLWPLLLAVATRARLPYDDLVATPLWPGLALAASFLAVGAARAMRLAAPFAVLAGAAVSLLPYWRRYPGYAEGLLVVFILGALAQVGRFDEEKGAAVRMAIFLTLAAWTKPEGLVAALAAAAVLFFARRARVAFLVALSAVVFAAAPWAIVVSRLAPTKPPTDFVLSSFSVANLGGALGALVSEGAPHAGWAAAAALLLALAPETRRARWPVLAWCGLYTAALVGSFAFTRLSPAWHVRWSWDRLAFIPVAVLLPVLAEALAECVRGKSATAPVPESPAASPDEAPAPAP